MHMSTSHRFPGDPKRFENLAAFIVSTPRGI